MTKWVTMDQAFSVVLAEAYVDKLSDDNAQAAVNNLHTYSEAIFCKLVNTKAGVPSNVLLVGGLDFGEPEYLDNAVALTFNFVVKFRKQLS